MSNKLSILGPPGSGKGTQAVGFCKELGIIHISTGDMLREAVRQGTALGLQANQYMTAGGLVPDEVIIGIVIERVAQSDCKNGFLLDGFPRTVPQAEALDASKARLDFVISMDISEEECAKRLVNRRSCTNCGQIYNILTRPPKKAEICDACGAKLVQRADDKPETVKERLRVYSKLTEPLIRYYQDTQRLLRVDATLSPDDVFKKLKDMIQYKVSPMGGRP